ncbi:MAG: Uncharacterised protein [Porticoccaceae bacterium UBA1117]|nr:MAG: Uncharacterised protein [Porticoccaceae bacterium UBA1117]
MFQAFLKFVATLVNVPAVGLAVERSAATAAYAKTASPIVTVNVSPTLAGNDVIVMSSAAFTAVIKTTPSRPASMVDLTAAPAAELTTEAVRSPVEAVSCSKVTTPEEEVAV